MKKVISLLLAMLLVFSMAVTAFADEGTAGSITINGASAENVYSLYKMLDLESYNPDTGAYSYKVNSDWTDFFTASGGALTYMAVDENGYVTWIAAEDDDTKATFAKLAMAFAQGKGLTPVKSSNVPGDATLTENILKFTGLELGYYLVDSTMGALCGLTTTNPDASINAKNGSPTIDKQVKEDSTDQWAESNTADIGQTVEFRVTINVHAGAQNYVLHDIMSEGLTFKSVSKIEHVVPGTGTQVVGTDDYSVFTKTGITETVDDDITEDNCTFEVRFTQAFCDELETNDKIIVYYEAMLNRNAVVAGSGNPNEASLEYGEDHFTTEDSTQTKTFGFDIVKTDSQNKLIDGAQFKIYDADKGGNEVPVVLMDDGVTYRRARADEPGVAIVVKDGKVRVVGFDNGTYYLEETVAPDGYNKLTARQKFIISDANLDSVFNDEIYSTGSGVHVVNKSGSMLPETGAAGTMMFIVFGTFVVLCTGVLLVTKKRMSMIED